MNRSRRVASIRIALICTLIMFFAAGVKNSSGQAPGPSLISKYVSDQLLVRFAPGVPASARAAAHAASGAAVVKGFETLEGLELVKLPQRLKVEEAIRRYRQIPTVLYAEPNYIVHALGVPNDPQFGPLWGLNNSSDADIDGPEAWGITTGSSNVVVGVIDTGIDYNHEDLSANMYRNTADCNNNGIDDDGNGFIDDCYGVDFANNDSDPMDDNQHGTHVAGTIGAVGNNGIGVTGVNWNVKLMACKFLDADGSGWDSDAISCLNYLAMMKDRGVNIVATNNSWGSPWDSQALHDAIDAHRQRGILFMAAAGNDYGTDNDSVGNFPSSYYLPNIIAVAATTQTDSLAWFSNFGKRTVHVGAPGYQILSTTPGNTYGTLSGTSMATPHVTGVAALLKAQDVTRDWRAIRNLILAGGDSKSSLTDTVTQKRLNAYGSLTCSGSTILSRLRPVGTSITASAGTPIDLAVLHINCAAPNGSVSVTVDPGGTVLTLHDDGLQSDQVAGDGVYSGQWTRPTEGRYTLTFPGGDVVRVYTPPPYAVSSTAFTYRAISGTNLDLSHNSVATIRSPFPVLFAGGSFELLHISNNGNVSFSDPFFDSSNVSLPAATTGTLVAPFWDDLYGVSGSAQNVFLEATGTAPNRELVIEWRDVRHYSCNGDGTATVKFQVVFFEGRGDILFNYADVLFDGACAFANQGASATVGVQVASNSATQYSFNTATLGNGTALLWTPSSNPAITVSPASRDFGSVPVGGWADRTFTFQNTGTDPLTGSASTSLPFSVVAGSSFSLAAGTSQDVVVRFSPASEASYSGSVN
ncbi:MAG: peptidase S8, partial [Acidobacteria bacterium]